MNYEKISKFMSLVLRHKPEAANVTLDEAGWCNIDNLVKGINGQNYQISRSDIESIVAEDAKGRYVISEDGQSIRANQGHSIKVDVGFEVRKPPAILYHGTADRFLPSIFLEGLKKMNRHHVHLSTDQTTASQVGSRHGKLVILKIKAEEMSKNGFEFFISANGVWLVDHVPPVYLEK